MRALGKMRFNKTEVAALALGQPSHKFEKEGVLFVREKQEGFFRRSESKYIPLNKKITELFPLFIPLFTGRIRVSKFSDKLFTLRNDYKNF